MRLSFQFLIVAAMLSLAAAEKPNEIRLGDPVPIPDRLYAFNSNLMMATAFHGISYGGPEFEQGLRDLRPGGLRFPGGTTANNYIWKEDSFSLQADDRTEWAAQQLELFRKIGRKYDLPGYAKVCRDHGLTPIYVLNIYEETPESVIELFERFDELELDVKAVEMGNEPYWDPRSLMNVWKYIEFCRPLAQAIREHRPEVKIGACFGPLREGSNYAEKWNAPLAKQTWFDAIVYHEYFGGQGFALEEGVELPLDAVLRPEALIDEPVAHFATTVPDKPIWFTEWNIGEKGLKQWNNTGAELLFIASAMTRVFEQREAFEWSCFHQIYEGKFGTFFYDKESGIQTLPSYELFRMIGAAWDGAESLRTIDCGDDDLLGFATDGKGGLRIVLVNRSDTGRTLTLPESIGDGFAALTIETDPTQQLPVSSGLAKPLSIDGGEISAPPFSITLIAPKTVVESAIRIEVEESGNLFPVRPHLTLWYKPFARKQPRVAADGSYTLNLAELTDKETVIVKMDLSGLKPEDGASYALTFEGSSTEGVGFAAKAPEGGVESQWIQLTPRAAKTRLEFTYDSEFNNGEVTFMLARNALSKGGELTLREFRVVRLKR